MVLSSPQWHDSCTVAILQTVADAENTSIIKLPPLYDVIDPESLEELVESASRPVTVEFTYLGYQITVSNEGVSLSESACEKTDFE